MATYPVTTHAEEKEKKEDECIYHRSNNQASGHRMSRYKKILVVNGD
jgi:hypothetical protein